MASHQNAYGADRHVTQRKTERDKVVLGGRAWTQKRYYQNVQNIHGFVERRSRQNFQETIDDRTQGTGVRICSLRRRLIVRANVF